LASYQGLCCVGSLNGLWGEPIAEIKNAWSHMF